jgi:predicted DNA-binding transcriptional regulator AlpA
MPMHLCSRGREMHSELMHGGIMNKVDMSALRQFDELPASAYVRLPVVSVLFGISTATVWRWSNDDHLPAPVRINGTTLWNVGALRAYMPPRSETPTVNVALSDAPLAEDQSKE